MAIQGSTKEKTRNLIKEPRQYKVIMHNDDFTTMEFVVSILEDIFHKSHADAETIMLLVHQKGQAAVGKYPYDIAMTKTRESMLRARKAGFPFRMTVEED